MRFSALAPVLALALLATRPAAAQPSLLDTFEPRITSFTLDNGLTFVVAERHDVPVVSFATYAAVGAVNEPEGQTGIAHMFEHMAFKGTTTLGTTDAEAEAVLLAEEEAVALALRRERAQGLRADSARVRRLEAALAEASARAAALVDRNAFERLLRGAGVNDLNAGTTADATFYFYSLPANKLELFFATEADRFAYPVLREFYTERTVVQEERRMRAEGDPSARLAEEVVSAAYKAHPYGRPVIGHMSDIENLTRTDAEAFFSRYYVPANLTIGIAGDVDPDEVRRLAETYFGGLEGAEPPLPPTTTEPEQIVERRVTLRAPTQPSLLVAYHRPSRYAPDTAVFTLLQDILGEGRTSRFHRRFAETGKAFFTEVSTTLTGTRYPTLFSILVWPNAGTTTDEIEEDLYALLDEVARDGVTDEELARAKTRTRMALVANLDSNYILAFQLASYQQTTGDWRGLFRQLDRLDAVTNDDIRRVARETFRPANRTVGVIVNEDVRTPSDAEASPSDES